MKRDSTNPDYEVFQGAPTLKSRRIPGKSLVKSALPWTDGEFQMKTSDNVVEWMRKYE
jgi:hypothetical protein